MPIYEFYCEKCNTVYKFLSRTVNTHKVPDCPRCGDAGLKRRMSLFAALSSGKEEGGEDGMTHVDEANMEKAISMLAKEAEGINEDDPRQAANLMRKLSDATGMKMGAGMEEAPEQIEQEMGDLLNEEDPFVMEGKGRKGIKKAGPAVDETLYEL